MKYSNDYEIVVEHKYYAVFRDGEGIPYNNRFFERWSANNRRYKMNQS